MFKYAGPPGPMLQRINAELHREPVTTIVYGVFWSTFLIVSTPIAIVFLIFSTVYKLCIQCTGVVEAPAPQSDMAVVITGCDSGFGKELALCCSDAGYTVFAGCLDVENLAGLLPKTIIPIPMDVTSDEQVYAAVEKISKWLSSHGDDKDESSPKRVLHALVNNAGVGTGGLIDWADISDFEFCMNVNFFGMVRCCKAFLPILKEQASKGIYTNMRIFNMTSMAGQIAGSMAAYGASKHAAVAFSSTLRCELRAWKIQVCTICPTFHGTPLVTSMGNVAQRQWDQLDATKQQEYGKEFYETMRCVAVDMPKMVCWNASVVVDEVMKGLKSERAPADLWIGTDAKFVFSVLRMLPCWFVDRIITLTHSVPLAMKNK